MNRLLAALLLLFTAPAWATNYYVWSGGTSAADCGTSGGFAAACTSFLDLFNSGFGTSGSTLASTDTVYVASDHDDSLETYAGTFTLYGPASGTPVKIISVARADSSYTVATSDQIDTRDGAYSVILDGGFSLYGIQIDSGAEITFFSDQNEPFLCYQCYLKPGNAAAVRGDTYQGQRYVETTISGVNDTGSTNNPIMRADSSGYGGMTTMIGGSFVNLSNRASILIWDPVAWNVSGVDFSANTPTTEIFSGYTGQVTANNLLVPSGQSWVPPLSAESIESDILVTNSGDEDRPWWLFHWQNAGYVEAQTTYTRDDGASIGGQRVAWQYTADAVADSYMYQSPWIYGSISTTGSKTLTIHVANATDDLTDKEAAIECQYFSTAGEAIWARITDLASITASGTAQADDTTSDWDNDLTYMQKLSVSPTIGQAGQFRCRVLSATTQGFYIDPKVVVE